MAVSQTSSMAFDAAAAPARSMAHPAVATEARLAGGSLLLTIASIVVFQAGGSIIGQGTRPDDSTTLAPIAAYFGHPGLAAIFTLGLVTVVAMASFAIAIRRYLMAFSPSPLAMHLIDLGSVGLVLLVGTYAVVVGLGLALIALVQHADPAAVGVFTAFTWLYDGTLNWIEGVAIGLVSLGALMTSAWPRWLGGFGLLVAALLLALAAPALLLGYPESIPFGAYGPEAAWMLAAGVHLLRGGRQPAMPR